MLNQMLLAHGITHRLMPDANGVGGASFKCICGKIETTPDAAMAHLNSSAVCGESIESEAKACEARTKASRGNSTSGLEDILALLLADTPKRIM